MKLNEEVWAAVYADEPGMIITDPHGAIISEGRKFATWRAERMGVKWRTVKVKVVANAD